MPLDQDALDALRMDRRAVDTAREGRARPWVLAAVGALAALGALAGWLALRPAPVAIRTAPVTVERGGGAPAGGGTVLSASGYVVARQITTVSSKQTGQIAAVMIEEGMTVKAGQVLARLDDAIARKTFALAESQHETARRALAETEVRLAEAEREVARQAALRGQALTSQAALDAAEAERNALAARLETARSEVEVAARSLALRRQDLDDTVIRAPFAGVVVSKNAQPGEMISPVSAGGGFTRTGICTIVDMSSLEVEVDVNEAYINRVRAGMRVEATLDAYPDWTIPAHVIRIVPTADRQKATVRVKVGFDALDPRILPDMGVQVRFLEDAAPAAAEGAAPRARRYVPADAVIALADGQYVFVVIGGERIERRAVTLGGERAGRVEVLAGLDDGAVVVLTPPPGLDADDRIDIAN